MSPERNSVIVDLDDTLCATKRAIIARANRTSLDTRYNYQMLRPGYVYDPHLDEIIHQTLKDPSFNPPPFIGALDGVKLLNENGFNVYIVSSRIAKYLGEATERWIGIRGFRPHIADLRLRPDGQRSRGFKLIIAQEVGAMAAFEDEVQAAKELASQVDHVFLIRRPWNTNFSNIDHPSISIHPSFLRAVSTFLKEQ